MLNSCIHMATVGVKGLKQTEWFGVNVISLSQRCHRVGPHMSAIHWTSLTQRAEAESPGLRAPMATTMLLSAPRAAASDDLAALQIPVSVELMPLLSPAPGRTSNCSP